MNKETELLKKEELSEEDKMGAKAAKWSNRELKGDIPEDNLMKELNDPLNEKSENDFSEDNLSDEETLRTTDATKVGIPIINSTTEKETRVDTLPEKKPSKNEVSETGLSDKEITKDIKPEEEMSLE